MATTTRAIGVTLWRGRVTKTFIKSLIPPIALDAARRVLGRDVTESHGWTISLRGDYTSWDAALEIAQGYEDIGLIERVAARNIADAKRFATGDFSIQEREAQVFTALLVSMQRLGRRGRIVDLGGEMGGFYRSLRRFLGHNLDWIVIETPAMVAVARELFTADGLTFTHDIAALLENKSDIVLASGVLQSLQHPHQMMSRIENSGAPFVVLTVHPFIGGDQDRLTVRTVTTPEYVKSYPLWMFSKVRWFEEWGHFKIVMEWSIDKADILENGEPVRYVGMLLSRPPLSQGRADRPYRGKNRSVDR